MPADYHSHTPLCRHATGVPAAYVDAAIAAGLSEYGISDHAPQSPEPFDDWRMREDQLPEYFDWLASARDHAAGRIPVRAGLECDWLPGNERWIENLATRYPWDYLIGSVHYLGSWDFDNPGKISIWSTSDVEDIWVRYWKTYGEMAATGFFDILGHPDLVKKFGNVPGGDLNRFYEPAIDAIASSGAAIEINTAGWHKPCADAYPDSAFLELACSAGVPLVISSDAHAPAEVGRDFAKAINRAKSAGYRETLLFNQRQRIPEALP
ncbi:MAG: histidinol-phosphatase HisJ family protein [Verrucomicrobiota bacterium]